MSAPPTDEQIAERERDARAKQRERESALARKVEYEALVYATIFEEVRKRLEGFTKWEERTLVREPEREVTMFDGRKGTVPATKEVEKIPPLLNGSDLKDVATTIYIQLSRGISWNR